MNENDGFKKSQLIINIELTKVFGKKQGFQNVLKTTESHRFFWLFCQQIQRLRTKHGPQEMFLIYTSLEQQMKTKIRTQAFDKEQQLYCKLKCNRLQSMTWLFPVNIREYDERCKGCLIHIRAEFITCFQLQSHFYIPNSVVVS